MKTSQSSVQYGSLFGILMISLTVSAKPTSGAGSGSGSCSQAAQQTIQACCIPGITDEICQNSKKNSQNPDDLMSGTGSDSTNTGMAGGEPSALGGASSSNDDFINKCSTPVQNCESACGSGSGSTTQSTASSKTGSPKQVCDKFKAMTDAAKKQKIADDAANKQAAATNANSGAGGTPSMPSMPQNQQSNNQQQQTPMPGPSGSAEGCQAGVSPVGCTCPTGQSMQNGSCAPSTAATDQNNPPSPAGFPGGTAAPAASHGSELATSDTSDFDSSGYNPNTNPNGVIGGATMARPGGSGSLPAATTPPNATQNRSGGYATRDKGVANVLSASEKGASGGFSGYSTGRDTTPSSAYPDYLPGHKKASRSIASVTGVQHPDIHSSVAGIFENIHKHYVLKCQHEKELRGCP